MSGEAAETPKPRKTWTRRIWALVGGLVAALLASAVVERVADPDWLDGAHAAQLEWLRAVEQTSPIGVASTYWTEISGVYSGDPDTESLAAELGFKHWLIGPLAAFGTTVWRSFEEGGITILIQIGMGALAVAVFNFKRTNGNTIFFDPDPLTLENVFFIPLAIMVAASLIGLVLWGVMAGALALLSEITGLAATAAGATGIGAFCWLCMTKLLEKGIEHVVTPKI